MGCKSLNCITGGVLLPHGTCRWKKLHEKKFASKRINKTNNSLKFVVAVINLGLKAAASGVRISFSSTFFFDVSVMAFLVQNLLIIGLSFSHSTSHFLCVYKQVYSFSFEAHVRNKLSEELDTGATIPKTKKNRDTIIHSESYCSAWDATSIKQGDHHFKCITRRITMDSLKQNNQFQSLRQQKIEEKWCTP